jgi:hypothetical protein
MDDGWQLLYDKYCTGLKVIRGKETASDISIEQCLKAIGEIV